MKRNWSLVVATGLCLIGYVGMVVIDRNHGTIRAEQVPNTIALYLVAFAGFLLAVIANQLRPFTMRSIWVGAVVFRLLLLLTEPTLSDDVYRYLWDGHLLTEGVNPYSYAIDDPAVDGYEIEARVLANNRDLASPYLPAAQLFFGLMALIAPSHPLSMQIAMVVLDLGAAALLMRVLAAVGQRVERVLHYLWNPLVVVELAHGAHIDGLMVFLSMVALWAVFGLRSEPDLVQTPSLRRRRWLSPLFLALATLTRPIPALLGPVLWWRWTWPQRVGYFVVAIGLLIPFGFGRSGWGLGESTGTGLFGSARVYSSEFRFNNLLSTWIELATVDVGIDFSLFIGAVMAVVLVAVWWSSRHADDLGLLRWGSIPLMAYVLLTPVLHPWYVVILMAMLVFVVPVMGEDGDRWWLLMPWWYLAASLVFSYITYRRPNSFGERDVIRQIEWHPTLWLVVAAAVVAVGGRNTGSRNNDRPVPVDDGVESTVSERGDR